MRDMSEPGEARRCEARSERSVQVPCHQQPYASGMGDLGGVQVVVVVEVHD